MQYSEEYVLRGAACGRIAPGMGESRERGCAGH